MGRSKKRSGRRRNVVIIALMVVGFAGLIAAVSILSNRQNLILPEVHAEKERLRGDATQNGYFDIAIAARDIPRAPISKLVPDPWTNGGQMEYKPSPGSIPDLLNVDRPLDDELTLQYIEDTRYIIHHVESAIAKPYYVPPVESHSGHIPLWHHDIASSYWPLGVYIGHAFVEIEFSTNPDRGFKMLENAYSFAVRIGNRAYYSGTFYRIHLGIRHAYRESDDPELRKRLRDFICEKPVPYQDWDANLEQSVGLVDETLLSPATYPERIPISVRINLFTFRRAANRIRDALPKLREVAQAHPTEWPALIDGQGWGGNGAWAGVHNEAWSLVLSPIQRSHWNNASHAAMPVILAIEDYFRDHKSYPETLDQLVPDYIDAIPNSPYSNAPYKLERYSNSVVLKEDWKRIPGSKDDIYYVFTRQHAEFRLQDIPEDESVQSTFGRRGDV